jgi:NADPH2:quinone reductase
MYAVQVNAVGGPEAFTGVEIDTPTPSATQVLVQLSVSGVNFLDVYQRNGATPLQAPFLAGVEGVGKIVEVGSEVTDLRVGQRVGWLSGGQGSFADFAAVESSKAVPIPDKVDDEDAAALLMQGVTAHYLATDTYQIAPGDHVIVHAAAGGVGQMLTQIAKIRGATVIGTVSTTAKAEVARSAGADHVASYDDFVADVNAITDGAGVAAVYDGVGAATFEGASPHSASVASTSSTAQRAGPPRQWMSRASTPAAPCTSPDRRSCTTPVRPRNCAVAPTTSSAGWRRAT